MSGLKLYIENGSDLYNVCLIGNSLELKGPCNRKDDIGTVKMFEGILWRLSSIHMDGFPIVRKPIAYWKPVYHTPKVEQLFNLLEFVRNATHSISYDVEKLD